jgi:type II secretory pathway pseudopilin PulG
MSLIEIMIAMVILGIVLVTIAKLSLDAAVAGRSNNLVATRTAVLQQQAARLGAIPYATLAGMSSGSDSITIGGTTYLRTITLTPAAKYTTVSIVIAPSSNAAARDSLVFTRANSAGGSPLCSGC